MSKSRKPRRTIQYFRLVIQSGKDEYAVTLLQQLVRPAYPRTKGHVTQRKLPHMHTNWEKSSSWTSYPLDRNNSWVLRADVPDTTRRSSSQSRLAARWRVASTESNSMRWKRCSSSWRPSLESLSLAISASPLGSGAKQQSRWSALWGTATTSIPGPRKYWVRWSNPALLVW